MKKATAGAVVVATATAAWWGWGGGKKPKPQPISADSVAVLANIDSFPVIVPRDTLGRKSVDLKIGEGTVLCALSRNRYTGEVRIFVPADAPVGADEYLATVCEQARWLYAMERSS